jgi:hypothetical protein
MRAQSMTAPLRADLRRHRNPILAVDNREILERSGFLTSRRRDFWDLCNWAVAAVSLDRVVRQLSKRLRTKCGS